MKQPNTKKLFLAELEKIPNISRACKKVGVVRNTFYEWKKKDSKFKEQVDKSIRIGFEEMCDWFEGQLISLAQEKDIRALRYFMDHRHPEYMKTNTLSLELNKETIGNLSLGDLVQKSIRANLERADRDITKWAAPFITPDKYSKQFQELKAEEWKRAEEYRIRMKEQEERSTPVRTSTLLKIRELSIKKLADLEAEIKKRQEEENTAKL